MAKNNSRFSSRIVHDGFTEPVFDEQALSTTNNDATSFDNLLSKPKTINPSNSRFQMSKTFLEQSNEKECEIEITTAEELKPLQKVGIKKEIIEHKDKLIDIGVWAFSIYFLFLSFGVWMTNYYYNDSGKIVAQQMTYEDIVEKTSFEVLLEQYVKCRDLYEKVLEIDKELAQGEVQPLTLAPRYETIISEAEVLYTKTEALSIDTKYAQVKSMQLSWLQKDLATYCSNMSAAISQNNQTAAQSALVARENTYADFSLITQNIVVMGENIPGVNLVNIKEWDATDIHK